MRDEDLTPFQQRLEDRVGKALFDRKLADLVARGYDRVGVILHKDGQYALFDSSCRWLTQPQYQRLMHEQDGSLFAERKPDWSMDEAARDSLREHMALTIEANKRADGLEAWHAAVLAECMRIEGAYDPADPAKTLKALIDWHVAVAQEVGATNKVLADNYLRLTCSARISGEKEGETGR